MILKFHTFPPSMQNFSSDTLKNLRETPFLMLFNASPMFSQLKTSVALWFDKVDWHKSWPQYKVRANLLLLKIKEVILKEMTSQTVWGLFLTFHLVAYIESNNWLMNQFEKDFAVWRLWKLLELSISDVTLSEKCNFLGWKCSHFVYLIFKPHLPPWIEYIFCTLKSTDGSFDFLQNGQTEGNVFSMNVSF